MDPNEALRLIRLTIEQMRVDDNLLIRAAHADEIAEYFEALDAWLSNDGFLPADWEAEEDKPSASGGPVRSDLVARFQPQAWQNDYAIPVDPQGETIWEVSEETADQIEVELAKGNDLDFVKSDPLAPEWVREWSGPFEIEVEDFGDED